MRLFALVSNGFVLLFAQVDVHSISLYALPLFIEQSPWGDVSL